MTELLTHQRHPQKKRKNKQTNPPQNCQSVLALYMKAKSCNVVIFRVSRLCLYRRTVKVKVRTVQELHGIVQCILEQEKFSQELTKVNAGIVSTEHNIGHHRHVSLI